MRPRNLTAEEYRDLTAAVYALLRRRGWGHHDAEDGVHETLVRLLSKQEDVQNPRALALQIARNLSIDEIRKRVVQREKQRDVSRPEAVVAGDAPFTSEEIMAVHTEIAMEPEPHRTFLNLVLLGGNSTKDALAVLGIEPDRYEEFKKYRTRFMARLRSQLSE